MNALVEAPELESEVNLADIAVKVDGIADLLGLIPKPLQVTRRR